MKNETEHDRNFELQIISRLQRQFPSRSFIQSAPFLPYDCYCLRRNADRDLTISSLIEFKRRSHLSTLYPTLILSVKKLKRLWSFARIFSGLEKWERQRSKLTPIGIKLFVQFEDGLKYADISEARKSKFEIKWGGRVDRGQARDLEMLAHIPMTEFKSI